MSTVFKYGNDWRYAFNVGKSAVLVFGSPKQSVKLVAVIGCLSWGEDGSRRDSITITYDYDCVDGDTHVMMEEKVSKARRVLNMSTNMEVRKGGLNLKTCTVIFWSVVIPTLLFCCEAWFIKYRDMELSRSFQRYAARRLQRLHYRSLNVTAVACLSWMDIVCFIKAIKIIFILSIIAMKEYMPIRHILVNKLGEHNAGSTNVFESTKS